MGTVPTIAPKGWHSREIKLPSVAELLNGQPPVSSFPSTGLDQRHGASRSNDLPILPNIHRVLPQIPELVKEVEAPILEGSPKKACPSPPNQLPSPAFTFTAATPACSTSADVEHDFEGSLEDLLKPAEPDFLSLHHCISELLDTSVKPAYKQGWYRPHSPGNEVSHKLEDKIRGLDRDSLVQTFFSRNEERIPYGERVTIPKRLTDERAASEIPSLIIEADPVALARRKRNKESSENHKEVEKKRRDQHRKLQKQSHLRCGDVVAECGDEHAREQKASTRSQSAKGPGKDEQLWAAIYAQELAARVVQSEHDRRKRAEKIIRVLLQFIRRQMNPNLGAQEEQDRFDFMHSTSLRLPTCVGKRRFQIDSDGEAQRGPAENASTDSESGYSRSSSSCSLWKRRRGLPQDECRSMTMQSISPSPTASPDETKAFISNVILDTEH
ncbi:uncharacterized protein Z518_02803 [Rhinocladiella mackenziei CBS 650.93]|uniref:Uncharacterized protein n=1 Tax=Rhinocladiella mackenziei CBS 650.93 TaxID=1442369 RepID=A0A0D2G0V3_9EURO|nr:uncharacterized protein Z518_02803 [Rhinocladiella mackenziei CBS 650.93]KIX08147.1 hypothetical protein Z518_02803 [Rhinocladiella mackenziei CBS 650.93]